MRCWCILPLRGTVVKEYKEEIEKLQKEKELLAKKLGETIVEKEWLEGKPGLHKNLNFYGTCL